jgi:cyclase
MITRIIPRLDIKGANLVKGIHLEGLRVLGKPERFARHYYEQGADELLFMDVVASLYGRNSLLEIIERTADEIFIPLAVGGGLRSLDDIRAVLRAGADKVVLNTAAVRRPEFITEAARRFGSSTIMVSVEAIRHADGLYEAYTDNGRERTGLDAIAWAERAADLGAGEVVVTSIDREGSGRGYDLELTREIARRISVPVIACGGAGCLSDVAEVLSTGAAAAALSSVLHYDFAQSHSGPVDEFAPEINIAHLNRPGFAKIQEANLLELKQYLTGHGITSRPLMASV